MNIEKIVGKRVQEYRKRAGLTQEELSEKLEISPHYLSALERGIYNIKLETLVKILNILDCSADEVFCDVVNKSFGVTSSRMSEKLIQLPIDEQNKILAVVDTMINNAQK
jgi:transcriptional regulator with XRE-family HTH domain